MFTLPLYLSLPSLSELIAIIIEFLAPLVSFFINLFNPYHILTAEDFELISGLLWLYLPWLLFLGLIKLFYGGVTRAKKRKAGIVIFASFLQMFMPDPYVERTIKTVQVQTKKQSESKENKKYKNVVVEKSEG